MNKLNREKQIEVVKALVEGMSIRATVRMTGVAKNTITKLLVDLGDACELYHDEFVRNLTAKRVQCDEIWSFVGAKDKSADPDKRANGEVGSIWTWTAIDADSKLIVSWLVGGRDGYYAHEFMQDVASRISNRVQLTTDGHGVYFGAVDKAFTGGIDYAMLVKKYGPSYNATPEARYSPATCLGAARKHQTLGMTPAMKAGLADHVWSIGEIVDLAEQMRFDNAVTKSQNKKVEIN
jgi:hypothetical protein